MIANQCGAERASLTGEPVATASEERVRTAKDELRRAARRVRDAIDPALARGAAERAAANLVALPELAGARRVAVFASVASELDAGPAARELRARGVELAYPRVLLPGPSLLEFRLVAGDQELVPGAFGIPEPRLEAPLAALDSIDAFVVPGLAFDRTGARVGWGRGFYDRSLAGASGQLRIGYCFECQLVDAVPRAPGDLPMHILVTESSVIAPPREQGPADGAS